MPTLIVASQSVLYDQTLAEAAKAKGWRVVVSDSDSFPVRCDEPVLYVSTDLAMAATHKLDIGLIEPPLDLLTQVPDRFLRRTVEFAHFTDLGRLSRPAFIKPADPLDKWFDAGIYSSVRMIRTRDIDRPAAPVLLSEPVEWSAEYRCFVLNGQLVEWSPYLSFGRPVWKVHARNRGQPSRVPDPVGIIVTGLLGGMGRSLPPTFVVDVGLIEDRGWAVVEFNPVWCAGLLGANPRKVLPLLRRATRPLAAMDDGDRQWFVRRLGS
jgi:hypothetical protein